MSRVLASVLVLAACGSSTPSGQTPPSTATPSTASGSQLSKDDAVFETVFLYELGRASLGKDEAACITTRGSTNDGSALLASLQAHYPTAIADKACSGGGPMGPVKVDATGGAAARFDIGPIQWMDDDHARVPSGGAHRGGGARETILELEKASGSWKVVGEKQGLTM